MKLSHLSAIVAVFTASLSFADSVKVSLPDWYFGQDDTGAVIPRDVIEGTPSQPQFDVFSMDVTYDFTLNTIKVDVISEYFLTANYGKLKTVPGDLLISSGFLPQNYAAWTAGQTAFGNHTKTDAVANQESWEYAIDLNGVSLAGYGNAASTPKSGTANIFNVVAGGVKTSDNWKSAANPGSVIYRAGQEVAYAPVAGQTALGAGTWAVDTSAGKLSITVPWIADFKTGAFKTQGWAFHWAMSCANDVIETYVPFTTTVIVPEPSHVALLGCLILGAFIAVRRRK